MFIPVESAMRTRREVRLAMKTGKARIGLAEMLSSSRERQSWRAGGRATRKLRAMSRATRVVEMRWSVRVRKGGRALGVLEEARRRWVVPASCCHNEFSVPKVDDWGNEQIWVS